MIYIIDILEDRLLDPFEKIKEDDDDIGPERYIRIGPSGTANFIDRYVLKDGATIDFEYDYEHSWKKDANKWKRDRNGFFQKHNIKAMTTRLDIRLYPEEELKRTLELYRKDNDDDMDSNKPDCHN